MSDGNDREAEDAGRVDEALELMLAGDLAGAEAMLRDVAGRTPPGYAPERADGDGLAVRWWTQDDFLYHADRLRQERGIEGMIAWLPNAYGRAHYYLGFLCSKGKRPEEALRWLDAGLALEPGQPNFHIEKGKVLGDLGDREASLREYGLVAAGGDAVAPNERAVALRGQGFQYIEMERWDEAERCYHESLALDPGNEIATEELAYIAHLRGGGERAPVDTVETGASGPGPDVCARCGTSLRPSEEGMDARLVFFAGDGHYLCERCQAKLTKKWWEFWK